MTPPPIFLRCKNTVEEEERHFLFQNKNGFVHLSPAMSRSITGYRNLKSKQGKREILPNLSPCVAQRYRGSAHRARGLEYKQKQQSPIPPLSGGEDARKTEGKGRGLFERSEFRRPRRRLRRQTPKPDNCGGASWFVLLAVEKNEQIKRISVTRTFFGWERKFFVSQSSLAVPRMRGIALQ